jgi:hypothetical protein
MCGLRLLASLSPYVLIVGMWLWRISTPTIYPKKTVTDWNFRIYATLLFEQNLQDSNFILRSYGRWENFERSILIQNAFIWTYVLLTSGMWHKHSKFVRNIYTLCLGDFFQETHPNVFFFNFVMSLRWESSISQFGQIWLLTK